jgi:hypothetical protein
MQPGVKALAHMLNDGMRLGSHEVVLLVCYAQQLEA